MAAFEYRQAEEIRDRFQAHGVRYLFLGKSGAILLGFSRYNDTSLPGTLKPLNAVGSKDKIQIKWPILELNEVLAASNFIGLLVC